MAPNGGVDGDSDWLRERLRGRLCLIYRGGWKSDERGKGCREYQAERVGLGMLIVDPLNQEYKGFK
jgi:hypothetical protein